MIDHGNRAHALLGASNSSRWTKCTPSARLEEQFPQQETDFSLEGTLAHEIADLTLKVEISDITVKEYSKEIKVKRKNKLFDDEMIGHADSYTDYVIDTSLEREGKSIIMTEQKVDFSEYIPEGFGTADAIIISDSIMDVIDFKYGKGVPVGAEDNTQMMCYALGALSMFSQLYDIETINMHIYQPRLDHIATSQITVEELLNWAETELKEKAEIAYKGEGQFVPGSHCKFCRAKHKCNARAEGNMELIKQDFADVILLDDERIEFILPKIDAAMKWLEDIKKYALEEALKGKVWKGFKLVEGKSNRKYKDNDQVVQALTEAGYPEAVVMEKKLLGITALEKALGKKEVGNVLKDLIEKPTGAPTLVVESDKRPAIDNVVADFETVADED